MGRFDRYDVAAQIAKLDENDLLSLVVQKFAGVDRHPDQGSNTETGLILEELIHRFAESSNETAGARSAALFPLAAQVLEAGAR